MLSGPRSGHWLRYRPTELFVLLGSPQGAYDTHVSWIAEEIAFARRLIEHDRPLLGICFGSQVIATALGGRVAPTGRFDAGWLANDEATKPIWGGQWFRWHGDAVDLPSAVDVMARSGSIVQAFRARRTLGVQFHPEIAERAVRNWVESDSAVLESKGYNLTELLDACLKGLSSGNQRVDALTDEIVLALGLETAPLRSGNLKGNPDAGEYTS